MEPKLDITKGILEDISTESDIVWSDDFFETPSTGEITVSKDDTPEEITDLETEDPEVKDSVVEEPSEIVYDNISSDDENGTKQGFDLVDGIRSVLQKKLERYNINTDEINLAEMDEEALASFEEELDDYIIDSRYNSVKQVDPNINKLLTFIENGGDPKALTKLFREQESIANIDTSTEQGKINQIKAYHKDVLKWDDDKISKKIDRLKVSDMLEDEFNDISEEFTKYYETKQEELVKTQEQEALKKTQLENSRKQAFSKQLESINIPSEQKNKIFNVAFGKAKYKGSDTVVDLFDHHIAVLKSDPEKFLKLAQYISDPELYDNIVLQNQKNTVVAQGLKKGFKEVTKKPVTGTSSSSSNTKTKVKFNFNS